MLALNLDGIPARLREMPNFVVCREEARDGKPTKVPYLGPKTRARTDMPSTWLTLATALRQMKAGNFPGLGFCRSGRLRFGDLDGCLDETESILNWDWGIEELRVQPGPLLEILEPWSYIESSVHGGGLHAVFFTESPITGLQVDARGEHRGVGYYTTTNRYLWLTGHQRSLGKKFGEDASAALAEAVAWALDLRQRLSAHKAVSRGSGPGTAAAPRQSAQPQPQPQPQPSLSVVPDAPLSDDELWALATRKGHHKLRAVLEGNSSGVPRQDMSASGFEFAAAQILTWYLGRDAARIDGFLRRIPGFSEREAKWESRRPGGTYGSETIANAMASVTTRYQRPRPPGRPPGGGGEPRGEKPPAADGFPWTEAGNGLRLAAKHGGDLRYVGPTKTWHVWDGMHWGRDETGRVHDLARKMVFSMEAAGRAEEDPALVKFALQHQTHARINAIVNEASTLAGIAIGANVFDQDPWLLNCTNGAYNLATGELQPHRREDMLAHLVPCDYIPGARSKLWDEYLESAQPDPETRNFLQKAAGYTLTGSTREDCCFLLIGAGRNGKGTFLGAMQHLLGDLACSANYSIFVRTLRDNSADLASFRDKRMVVAQEAGTGVTFSESTLKTMTGGDIISAKALYQNPISFKPVCKIWLSSNELPEVRDASPGFWQRIRVIPFNVSFAGREDRSLRDLLASPAHFPAILAWAIEGAARLREEGLGMPPGVQTATTAYREDNDTVAQFLDEDCILDPEAVSRSGKLFTAYLNFCIRLNTRPVSHCAFSNSLKSRGFASTKSNFVFFYGLRLSDRAPD